MNPMNINNHKNPEPMTIAQLIELAGADALGLLDEGERASFEAALAAAPEHVRAMVRSQQSLQGEALSASLPGVEPRAELRDMTIDRVLREAGTAGQLKEIAGRIEAGHMTLPSRGVSPVWRAAAIGSIAAALVFGVALFSLRYEQRNFDNAARADAASAMFLKEFGSRFENALVNPRSEFIKFDVASAGGPKTGLSAILIIDPTNKTGTFFVRNLPDDLSGYSLSMASADGTPGESVLEFRASGKRAVEQLNKTQLTKVSAQGGMRLVIKPSAPDAKPLLQSTNL